VLSWRPANRQRWGTPAPGKSRGRRVGLAVEVDAQNVALAPDDKTVNVVRRLHRQISHSHIAVIYQLGGFLPSPNLSAGRRPSKEGRELPRSADPIFSCRRVAPLAVSPFIEFPFDQSSSEKSLLRRFATTSGTCRCCRACRLDSRVFRHEPGSRGVSTPSRRTRMPSSRSPRASSANPARCC
jgi:hypothetical protein